MEKYRCMGCMQEYDSNLSACPNCAYPQNVIQNEPYCLSEGTLLDNRYIIGRVLGSGSFSVTYLAWDTESGKKIVIKEYFPKTLASRMLGQQELNSYDGEKSKQYESGLLAFVDEANNLKNLSQSLDGVAKTLDVFIENSTAYSITEYIDGISLDQVLQKSKLPWEDVIQFMNPLLHSMIILQENAIVCYNISPDNIIMTRDKKVKLLGFGSSKFATGGATMDFNLVTKTGYSPIEMYRDGITPESSIDVYSLAAVIYYAVTGIVPPSSVERVADDSLQSPLELGIHVPKNVNTAIMNALNVNAKYRTKDCATFLDELNSVGEVRRILAIKEKEETGKMSKKTKAIIISVAVVVVAVIAGIVFAATGINSSSGNESSQLIANYEDKDKEEVIKELDELGIKYHIVGREEKDGVEKGKEIIAWQSVAPNTEIKDIKEIELKVAVPSVERGKIPNLSALTKGEAITALKKAGFTNYKFEAKENNQYKQGLVCDQSVDAGKNVAVDTKIVVYTAKNVTTATTAVKKTSSVRTTANSNKSQKQSTKKPNTAKSSTTKKTNQTTTKDF